MSFLKSASTIPWGFDGYSAWHRDRPYYAVWAIDLADRALAPRVEAARGHLTPWLRQDQARQLHLTLSVCGFPSTHVRWPDDYPPTMLRAQIAALRNRAIGPFDLAIGQLESFDSAAFLAARSASLFALGDALETKPRADYVPHVTIGTFAHAVPADILAARLAEWPDVPPIVVTVDRLSLLLYRSAEIEGPLTEVGAFDLRAKSFRFTAAARGTLPDDWLERKSPCTKICRIDPASGLCAGCLRTLDEIQAWSVMTDDRRRQVVDELPGRREGLLE